jgi:feruloyl esterase
VIRACGNAHGIITDPRHCGFNPASIRCPPGQNTDSCLTPAQVRAVREFYRGPADQRGRSLYNGGLPYGSELGWIGNFVQPASDAAAPGDTFDAAIALNYLKYMAFIPNPPDSFTLADVRFTDAEFARLNLLGDAIYNANHPDLRAFAARGGKLILYHGWADPTIPPWSTLDYYAAVEHASGGFRASQAFSRLYMIPGASHCLYAPDFSSINLADFLTPLISWVQHGIAPGTIEADTLSLTTYKITLHQKVRPYNALAPVTPAPGSLNGHYHYLGTYH